MLPQGCPLVEEERTGAARMIKIDMDEMSVEIRHISIRWESVEICEAKF